MQLWMQMWVWVRLWLRVSVCQCVMHMCTRFLMQFRGLVLVAVCALWTASRLLPMI
jgi:hypothetical protein